MSEARISVRQVGDVLRSADLLEEGHGPEDVYVSGVCQDSRLATEGDLFVAWVGTAADGHDYVAHAASAGAVAAVVERRVEGADIPQLVVRNGRRAAALVAEAVMDRPSRSLLTVGITGTNGKTTTATLIRHLLEPEIPTAVIGTLGVVVDGSVVEGTEGLTTPGPVQVAMWLRRLADGGTRAVVMEASSHALEQHRLDGVAFDVAVFTNLTQDHLDYHRDLESYRAAKARLTELVDATGTIIVNADDPAWAALETGSARRVTYGIDRDADVRADDVELSALGSEFTLTMDGVRRRVRMPLVARFNVQNAVAAVCAARAAGVDADSIAQRLGTVPPVPGRLEAVVTRPFTVLIDFAHTPAALEGALAAVKPLTEGRLIVVFGAGGDRDRTTRVPMAEAVRAIADVIVLTNDNPRTEDPEQILDDVAAGLEGARYERFVDRREAIRRALEIARPGDTVVLAGKGHETYQTIGTEKLPFDEREIVRECLAELGVTS